MRIGSAHAAAAGLERERLERDLSDVEGWLAAAPGPARRRRVPRPRTDGGRRWRSGTRSGAGRPGRPTAGASRSLTGAHGRGRPAVSSARARGEVEPRTVTRTAAADVGRGGSPGRGRGYARSPRRFALARSPRNGWVPSDSSRFLRLGPVPARGEDGGHDQRRRPAGGRRSRDGQPRPERSGECRPADPRPRPRGHRRTRLRPEPDGPAPVPAADADDRGHPAVPRPARHRSNACAGSSMPWSAAATT